MPVPSHLGGIVPAQCEGPPPRERPRSAPRGSRAACWRPAAVAACGGARGAGLLAAPELGRREGGPALEGSLIGGIADTREMMQFAHSHGLGAEIELIQPDEIETAWHRLHEGDVQYRFVIDLESLASG